MLSTTNLLAEQRGKGIIFTVLEDNNQPPVYAIAAGINREFFPGEEPRQIQEAVKTVLIEAGFRNTTGFPKKLLLPAPCLPDAKKVAERLAIPEFPLKAIVRLQNLKIQFIKAAKELVNSVSDLAEAEFLKEEQRLQKQIDKKLEAVMKTGGKVDSAEINRYLRKRGIGRFTEKTDPRLAGIMESYNAPDVALMAAEMGQPEIYNKLRMQYSDQKVYDIKDHEIKLGGAVMKIAFEIQDLERQLLKTEVAIALKKGEQLNDKVEIKGPKSTHEKPIISADYLSILGSGKNSCGRS